MGYTPAPWYLEEVGDKCKHLCPAKDGVSLLTVAIEYQDDGEANYIAGVWDIADARLISAAPELLETLVTVRDALLLDNRDPWWDDLIKTVNMAIAKATVVTTQPPANLTIAQPDSAVGVTD